MRLLVNYVLLIFLPFSMAWNLAMAQQSEKTKTWCIGRFMVTLPANAEIKMERDKYFYNVVESSKSTRQEFYSFLKEKEGRLRAQPHEAGGSLLKKTIPVGADGRVLIFFNHKWDEDLANIESYRYMNGRKFLFSSKFVPKKEATAIKASADLLNSLKPRPRSEIPSTPGFCIDYGFIPDEGYNNEKLSVEFVFKGQPDMYLDIDTLIKEPGPTLLERSKGALSMLGALAGHVHTVRSGKRALGPLSGEEWLVKVPTEGGNVGHQFTWETQGEGRSDYPYISIEFHTSYHGDSVDGLPSSLNDRQALEFWDSLLSSFRLRPTSKP